MKLRISHYARCGVGDKQNGLRAMLGATWKPIEICRSSILCRFSPTLKARFWIDAVSQQKKIERDSNKKGRLIETSYL